MRNGYTLVELSIVLVIIGLLIGGILVAQSMIETVKIQNTIREFEQYNISALLFQERYKRIPGDSNLPMGLKSGYAGAGIFDTTNPTYNIGNNNGVIGTPTQFEAANFWYHLKQLGFIDYSHKGVYGGPGGANEYGMAGWSTPIPPIVKPSPTYGSGNTSGGGWWILGIHSTNTVNLTQTFECRNAFGISQGNYAPSSSGVITNLQASTIDNKIDDGQPLSGKVTAVGAILSGGPNYVPRGATDATYSTNCLSGTSYRTSYRGYDRNCGILICGDF